MNIIYVNEARELEKKLSTLEKVKIALIRPRFLGMEKAFGFSGPTPMYLFYCFKCSRFAKDHLHGYRGSSYYLRCPHSGCHAETLIKPTRRERSEFQKEEVNSA